MPLAAMRSTSDWASPAATFAADLSVPSTILRRLLSPVRSFERRRRLASRRLMFCRFAFSADLFRFATDGPLGLLSVKPMNRPLYHCGLASNDVLSTADDRRRRVPRRDVGIVAPGLSVHHRDPPVDDRSLTRPGFGAGGCRNLPHILSCFRIRWHVAITIDAPRAGVIGRQRQFEVLITLQQQRQIRGAAANVLLWIERIRDVQGPRCRRHQLHQTLGALGGYGAGVEPRFVSND